MLKILFPLNVRNYPRKRSFLIFPSNVKNSPRKGSFQNFLKISILMNVFMCAHLLLSISAVGFLFVAVGSIRKVAGKCPRFRNIYYKIGSKLYKFDILKGFNQQEVNIRWVFTV